MIEVGKESQQLKVKKDCLHQCLKVGIDSRATTFGLRVFEKFTTYSHVSKCHFCGSKLGAW
jgi:hypothetical protein